MTNIELENYVRECRTAGIEDTAIRKKLSSVGWLEADVKSALKKTSSGQSPRKFSLKLLLILILSVLVLGAIAFAGYYILILKKSVSSSSNQETANTELTAEVPAPTTSEENSPENSAASDVTADENTDSVTTETARVSCTADEFDAATKPVKIGLPKARITSTMNLFISALEQGNRCHALSLFADRDKYEQTIGSIFSSENNVTIASEFKNFTIPANINIQNLLTLKATTKVKDENGMDIVQEIFFTPQASGEYMISQF